MLERELVADLLYENTGKAINAPNENPVFIRDDTIIIVGNAYGSAIANVMTPTPPTTNLTAVLTGKMILPDGTVGATVFTANATVAPINAAVCNIRIELDGATKGFQPGQRFVFDVEMNTTGTKAIKRSVKGKFSIEEDYTI